MRVRPLLPFVLGLICACPLLAQDQAQTPCATAEFRQFDFWVGEWELTWPASETSGRKPGRGTNRIERAFDNCVIVEHFTGTPSIDLRGMSVSTFNTRKGKWHQTWVDSSGSYLDFVGEFKDGQMILSREATTREGKPFLQRMVWKNIKADSLDWSWERSDDVGQTWKVLWPIHYQRMRILGADSCPDLAPEDADAVRQTNLAYPAAWLANNPEAVMRIFSEDAVLIPHHGDSPIEGKPAIREHFWPPNLGFFTVDTYRMIPVEVSGCGDLAYSRGRFSIQFTTEVGGERKSFSNEGNYMMVFRKNEGRWLITRYIWNDPILTFVCALAVKEDRADHDCFPRSPRP
ncbi:MAG: YybH family protein [bacterium]